MNQQIKKYWEDFCQKHNLKKSTPVEAWALGYSDQEANKLAQLVNKGIKTATTSSLEGYQEQEIPQVGEYSIILDAKEQPVCVIKDVKVEVVPYNQITADYAYQEGEGDRSFDHWKKVHDEFFEREFREVLNKKFSQDALMVCEIFEKIN